jgi:hypothetical protein
MKQVLIAVLAVFIAGMVYAQDAAAESEAFKAATQEEIQLTAALSQNMGEVTALKVMNQLKLNAKSQNQYKETLQFMYRYMKKNGNVKDADTALAVGETYAKNCGAIAGTAHEKQVMMMSMVQKMVANQMKSKNGGDAVKNQEKIKMQTQAMMKTKLQEKGMSGEGAMYKYQYRYQYKWASMQDMKKAVPVTPKH